MTAHVFELRELIHERGWYYLDRLEERQFQIDVRRRVNHGPERLHHFCEAAPGEREAFQFLPRQAAGIDCFHPLAGEVEIQLLVAVLVAAKALGPIAGAPKQFLSVDQPRSPVFAAAHPDVGRFTGGTMAVHPAKALQQGIGRRHFREHDVKRDVERHFNDLSGDHHSTGPHLPLNLILRFPFRAVAHREARVQQVRVVVRQQFPHPHRFAHGVADDCNLLLLPKLPSDPTEHRDILDALGEQRQPASGLQSNGITGWQRHLPGDACRLPQHFLHGIRQRGCHDEHPRPQFLQVLQHHQQEAEGVPVVGVNLIEDDEGAGQFEQTHLEKLPPEEDVQ